jgi:hypothetical protein
MYQGAKESRNPQLMTTRGVMDRTHGPQLSISPQHSYHQHDPEARTERKGSVDSLSIRNQSGEWVDVSTTGLKLTITADGRAADDDSITLRERAQRAATLVLGFFDLFLFADATPRPLRFARSCVESARPFDNFEQEPKERPESPVRRKQSVREPEATHDIPNKVGQPQVPMRAHICECSRAHSFPIVKCVLTTRA